MIGYEQDLQNDTGMGRMEVSTGQRLMVSGAETNCLYNILFCVSKKFTITKMLLKILRLHDLAVRLVGVSYVCYNILFRGKT